MDQRWKHLNPNRSLKARLMLGTVGGVLLLSLLLSTVVGNISKTQLQAATNRSLEELAFQMADKLDRGMFERYRDLQILSSLDALRQPEQSIAGQRLLLQKLQDTYPSYAWIGMTDTKGTVLASTGGLLEGKNASKREWFQVGQSKPYVGDVHEALLLAKLLPNETDEPLRFVDVATPITDPQGKLRGVLASHLSWAWAREVTDTLIGPQSEQSQVEILVLSQDGTVLLGPATLQGETLPEKMLRQLQADSGSNLVTPWPQEGKFAVGFAKTQGYLDYPGLGWTVLIRQPLATALAPARSLQAQVLTWGIGLGSLVALLSWLFVRRIARSMVQLTAAADLIRAGNSGVKMPKIKGQDELARLASSLRHMVHTLRNQRQKLQFANHQLQNELVERQRTAAKIQEQAELLNIATDAIFVRDLENRILFWNQGAQHMYGWSEAEACTQNATALLNPKLSAHQDGQEPALELTEAFQTVMHQGEWRGEIGQVTKSGEQLVVESRWALAYDSAGQPKFILTVNTDITEKKRLETQFFRAQRLESLGTLASGIAHDLNNIFTPILSSAQLLPLLLKQTNEKSDQAIAVLEHSAQRGRQLVNQILTFSRGSEGKQTLVNVEALLQEIQQMMGSSFQQNLEFNLELPQAPLPAILGDVTQLHQVLMNLCVNAKDAMPEGGLLQMTAAVTAVEPSEIPSLLTDKAAQYLAITVADTGIGIAPEVMESIFDPFFTTKEPGKGTGLGLATAHGIIQKHAGFIQVDSKVSQGTIFKIFLPIPSPVTTPTH